MNKPQYIEYLFNYRDAYMGAVIQKNYRIILAQG